MSYFPFVQVVRQKDAHFSRISTKVGDAVLLERNELDLIESQFVPPAMATILAPNAVRLYYSNEAVNAYNVALAKGDPGSVQILARDQLRGLVT
ncbi:hypothetical protein HPB48_007897 [Haemaphysalis longicornis]|uniref:Uncharacterized protein n=1 Tax=Haemaphysalis longicornis TaxID=44386 RepID=A0A9J6G5N8_HAELO|nr:hypothetical protein HPB48_007897 [Haemaphysalis longicornis]